MNIIYYISVNLENNNTYISTINVQFNYIHFYSIKIYYMGYKTFITSEYYANDGCKLYIR